MKQGKKESPSAFHERLCEVVCKGNDLDPESERSRMLFNLLFISGMVISHLMSSAYKVYNNRDKVEEKQKKSQAKF